MDGMQNNLNYRILTQIMNSTQPSEWKRLSVEVIRGLFQRVFPHHLLSSFVSANEGSFLRWLKKKWLSRRSDSGHVVFLFVSSTSLFV